MADRLQTMVLTPNQGQGLIACAIYMWFWRNAPNHTGRKNYNRSSAAELRELINGLNRNGAMTLVLWFILE
jgi:hypothetical protein